MRHAISASCALLAAAGVAILATATAPLDAQTRAAAKPAAKAWAPARTPDGQPDLQGIWTNATITPFERPAALAGKEFLTEQEAAQLEQQNAERRDANRKLAAPGRRRQLQRVLVRLGDEGRRHAPHLARDRSAGWPSPAQAVGRRGAQPQPEERRFVRVDEPVGSLHHARPGPDVSGRLQQRLPDSCRRPAT